MYDTIRSKVTQLTADKFRDAQPPQLLLHDYTYLYFIRLVYVQYTCSYTPNVNKSKTRPSRLTDQTKPMFLLFRSY